MNKAQLRQLIAENRLDEAIRELLALTHDTRFQQDVVLLSSRFSEYKSQEIKGIESFRELELRRNQITHALLAVVEQLPDSAPTGSGVLPPSGSPVFSGTGDGKSLPRTGTGDGGASANRVMWIGLVSLGLILAAVLFVPCPSSAQFFVFRLILAIGAAGIGSLLPGFINIKSGAVKASGALGLFVLVYWLNPAVLVGDERCQQGPITLTVFVHGKGGVQDILLRQQGHVLMDVPNERKRQPISDNGEAYFPNVHAGDKVRLEVDFSEPYRALYPDSAYTVPSNGHLYLAVALQGLDKFSGTVLFNDAPLPGVVVSVEEVQDTTDALGRYLLRLPETAQRKEQQVQFFKPGYQLRRETFYPQTGQPLDVVMKKGK